MLIAFAGIVLVITNGNFSHLMASSSFIGDLLLLAATVCWVIYTYFANVMNSVYRWNIQKEIFITRTRYRCLTIFLQLSF